MLPPDRAAISPARAASSPRPASSAATTASGNAANLTRWVRDWIVGSSESAMAESRTKCVLAPGSSSVLSSALAADVLSSSAWRTMNTLALPSCGANAARASTSVRT